MIHSDYAFSVELLDATGRLTRTCPIDEDAFMPCYEDTLFTAICAGYLPNSDRFPDATVEPCSLNDGTPYLSGVTIQLPPLTRQYGLDVFSDLAYHSEKPATEFSDPDESDFLSTVVWRLRAEPRQISPGRRTPVTLRRHPYPLHRESLDQWGIPHLTIGPPPFTLYVSKFVIAELRESTVGSLHIERADILTGRVIQDPDGTVAVIVTGRTPATVEAEGTAAAFRFSPLTFAAARAESLFRDPACTIVGWSHNHPACQDCPMNEPFCASNTVFFSVADRQVHRTSFAAPYAIGLVLGKGPHKSPTDPIVRAYAWNHGTLCEHTMHVY
jgi:hypothetical protein